MHGRTSIKKKYSGHRSKGSSRGSFLFASNAPLPFNKIREVTEAMGHLRPRILREILQELQYDYTAQQHSFRLEEIAQGYILRTCEEFAPFIDLMYRNKRVKSYRKQLQRFWPSLLINNLSRVHKSTPFAERLFRNNAKLVRPTTHRTLR